MRWQGTGTCHLGAAMSTTICSIFSSILAMYFSFLVLGWEKTAKIQKKWDIPKGQPHFLTLKIVYLCFLCDLGPATNDQHSTRVGSSLGEAAARP